MSLFRLDASIRVDGSQSRQLADLVEQPWRRANPDAALVRRNLAENPIPAETWVNAVSAGYVDEADRTEAQRAALRLAANLGDELVAADAYIFAAPLYNFGVSQHLKTWIDLIFTDKRFPPSTQEAPIKGRPAVLLVARGGGYGPGTPREGWDHSTGYLRRILHDVWGADLTVVEREFTLVGVNPALDDFKDLAAGLHQGALASAREAGKVLAAARVG